jgi:hypothetical protein
METPDQPTPAIEALQSGYAGDAANWKTFLECWSAQVPADKPSAGLIRRAQGSTSLAEAGQRQALAGAESRLGLRLPASFKDFHVAFASLGLAYAGEGERGLFAPGHIVPLKDHAPHIVEEAEEWPVESPDARYYRYGTDQDTASGRTKLLRNALVVGQYGSDPYELVILYPDSLTADGEMEAALRYHAGEFRAPGFAELMRQVSYWDTKESPLMPPYAQAQLIGTCAERLQVAASWK